MGNNDFETEIVFGDSYEFLSNGEVYGPKQLDDAISALEKAKNIMENEYNENRHVDVKLVVGVKDIIPPTEDGEVENDVNG